MRARNKLKNGLGWLKLIVVASVLFLTANAAHAAFVEIDIDGITTHAGGAMPVGRYVQILQSTNAVANTPNDDGTPGGDDSYIMDAGSPMTGTISPAGQFTGTLAISNVNIFIRVWENWNGVGEPAEGAYYGDSTPALAPIGFGTFNYTPAGFSTDDRTTIPAPTITHSPATVSVTITEGEDAPDTTFQVGNSGTARLDYTLAEGVAWISRVNPGSGGINAGGANVTHTIEFSTAGLAAAGSPYNTNITVTDPDATNSPHSVPVRVIVNAAPIELSSIAVTPVNPSVTVGNTRQFTATGTYSDGSTRDITADVAWHSSNVAAATINAAGRATAVAVGVSNITAALDGETSPVSRMTVTAVVIDLSSIAVTPVNPSVTVGNTRQFTATGTYSDGSTGNITADVAWHSSNVAAATINAAGLATAVAEGVSNITAALDGETSPVSRMTVTAVVADDPTISGATPATAAIGQTVTIAGNNFDPAMGASTVTIGGVAATPTSWSNDEIVVTVPAGVAAGAANIVVTVAGAASDPFGITITAGGDSSIIVIDDMEGGAVGNFEEPTPTSGYYVFDLYDDTVADPRNTTSYPDRSLTSVAAEVREGSQAMELMYDYASRRAEPHAAAADADWGGGWGAILASERNVSTANTIYFWLRGEGVAGSGNRVRIEVQDADGTVFASSDPNNPAAGISLNFAGYTQIAIPMSRFVNNAAQTASTYGKPAGNAAMDWARIVKYNFIYATTNDNATEANHYVDTIWAAHSDEPPPTEEATPVTVSPSTAYVGQTIVITGSGFGATQGTSTITIGGVAVHPTVWSTGSITAAVPSGVSGAAAVSLTVGANPYAGTVNITAGGAVIEDYEGGSVDDWEFDYTGDGNADSGYYVFASVEDITPNNETINADLRQAAAARNGSFGARVRYSYVGTDGSDWGGGWGASLANTLNLDPYDTVNLSVRWDGSSNAFKISLRDSKGTIYAATVSNAQLVALAGTYGEIRINKTSFTYDAEDPANVAGALNWTEIVSYNLAYITPNTSSADHYIDSITAGDVTLGEGGTDEVITTDVSITAVSPSSAPAGTAITISGAGFGTSQGSSVVVFENQLTRISYPVEVKAWGNVTIEAKIPTPAPVGNYTLKVIKIAVSAGTLRASESNPAAMSVTSILAEGTAIVFPNPFNPLATTPAANGRAVNQATIVFTTTGSQDIGIYIYDMTGRQVRHATTTDAQWIWDGRDQNNNIVADGLYLLRIVNQETKKLVAKSKILVTKK